MSAFTIYPAIDIRDGKCVRLVQGDYAQETIYNENTLDAATEWEAKGAEWIHLVDLDGAKAGRPVNHEYIGAIAKGVNIPVQVGGGIRSLDDVETLLKLGVARIILGTAAIEDRAFVSKALNEYGERIAIGIDARDGYVATRGWLETSQVKAEELAIQLAEQGAKTFIFTDISRDGMLSGPNVESIVRLAQACGQAVIASGGVSNDQDLLDLAANQQDGVVGAIVGKALYTGSIDLSESLKKLKRG